MVKLKMENINKIYANDILAIEDFNLQIYDKEFIVLVGPSGCGKSTILRMVAGLEDITSGDLYIDDKKMNEIPPKDRDVAMAFQNYALYPHMNVYDNIAFGLKIRKFKKEVIKNRVHDAAEVLGLKKFLNRKPKELSGGQRQRVALGRAIVRNPNVFLMDEPLSNLDAKLRMQMRSEIKKIHERMQTTTIYVTHDQTEAMTMATRLVVLKDGIIQQIGSPKEVYDYPENMFVGGFIGSPPMNFFQGTLKNDGFLIGKDFLSIPEEVISTLDKKGYINQSIILGIRPENIFVEPEKNISFSATIDVFELMGAESYLYSNLNEQKFTARVNSRQNFNSGDTVNFSLDTSKLSFFDPNTKKRIY